MRPSNEALLISALVNSGDCTQAVAFGLEPEMFTGYQAEYRWLLSYFSTYGSSPAKETLLHRYRDFPFVEVTDVAYHCDEVLYDHQRRQTAQVIRRSAAYLQEGDLEEALMTLGGFQVAQRRSPLANALLDTSILDKYDERVETLRMPWKTLDNLTGGIRPGNFWTIAARYGHGKSWVLGEVITTQLMEGKDVLLYSLEMPKDEVLVRIHVLLGAKLGFDVDHVAMRDRIYDRIQYRKIVNAIKDSVPGQLFIEDSGKVTSARVAGDCDKADLTVVDYLGLMHSNTGEPAIKDWRVAATISNQLKETALNHNARIICAAQINRDGDGAAKLPPKSKTLAQSDAIGQDSDVIVTAKRYADNALGYLLDKNRHGPSGVYFFSAYEPNIGNFAEISRESADDRRYESDYTD